MKNLSKQHLLFISTFSIVALFIFSFIVYLTIDAINGIYKILEAQTILTKTDKLNVLLNFFFVISLLLSLGLMIFSFINFFKTKEPQKTKHLLRIYNKKQLFILIIYTALFIILIIDTICVLKNISENSIYFLKNIESFSAVMSKDAIIYMKQQCTRSIILLSTSLFLSWVCFASSIYFGLSFFKPNTTLQHSHHHLSDN